MNDLTGIERWLAPDETLDTHSCDREPIHVPGAIQCHGVLLCFDQQHRLVQCSENWHTVFDTPMRDRIVAEVASSLEGELPKVRKLNAISWLAIYHTVDGVAVVELEPASEQDDSLEQLRLNAAFDAIDSSQSVAEAIATTVRQIQRVTGYDRVMAYMFDQDGHGTVVAEEILESATCKSYLGLRFPSTDIPKQARRLYTVQWTRQIADVEGARVKLEPALNPVLGRPLNMAWSQLRSVSPIHIEYLKNMGVSASFSVSLIVNEELIGLLACHHMAPKKLTYGARQAAESIGRYLSQRFDFLATRDDNKRRTNRLTAQVELLAKLSRDAELSPRNEAWLTLLDFVESDSLLVQIGGERRTLSNAAGSACEESVWNAAAYVASENEHRCTATTELRVLQPKGPGGGMLVVPIPGRGFFAWYRKPIDRVVFWAGAPPADEQQKELTPRSSFNAYKQRLEGHSEDWSLDDLELAEMLRRGMVASLVELDDDDPSFALVLRQMREYVDLLQDTNQRLQANNEDLRQFAYAASHDLKAPLRTIRSFLPMIKGELEAELAARPSNWFNFVTRAADNLHRLQDGLWNFSRVNRETSFVEVPLNDVMALVLDGLAADFQDATVQVGDLPTVPAIPQQLETVFRNLLDNASKYRSSKRELKVVIESQQQPSGWIVRVSDNGIGFPPNAAERVFELFSRLHVEHKNGDGIGLAMCRRILNHHGGWIRAESDPGAGTSISLFLRKEVKAS